MLSKVRIGMVGAGAVAARHVRTLLAMDGVEVAAVADPALERAKELAAEAGAAAYPNHMELLAAERLDAVYICVPPFAHGAPELAVIDAGLPMFVEKPVAIDQETAAAIAARLAGRPLVTCTGYHWRWLDIFDRAAEPAGRPAGPPRPVLLARQGPSAALVAAPRRLGRPDDRADHPRPRHRPGPGRRGHRGPRLRRPGSVEPAPPPARGPRTGGSRRRAGGRGPAPPGHCRPRGHRRRVGGQPPVRLRAVGTVASTCLLPRLHRAGVQVVADGLSLELTETELVVEVDGRRSVWEADADARPRPDRDFVAAVRGGADRIRVPWPEAYRTHLLACAITRSAEEGRPLPVPEARGRRWLTAGRCGCW